MREVVEILIAVTTLVLGARMLLSIRRAHALVDEAPRHRERVAAIARELNLQVVESAEERSSLAGWIDGFYVELQSRPGAGRSEPDRVDITIDAEARIPTDLRLTPRLLPVTAPAPAAIEPRIAAGNHNFESRVLVEGHELSARAVLDEGTRSLALNVVGRFGVWVDRGVVGWSSLDEVRLPVFVIVRRMIELASALALDPQAVPERLRRIALEDEVPAVRLRSLARLVEHYPASDTARRACEDGLRDGDASVRLLAAKHQGDAGMPLVREIAGTEGAPHEARAEALRHLVRFAPRDAIDPLFAAFRSRSRRMQNAALAIFAELPRGFAPVERLLEALAAAEHLRPATADVPTANALARALGRTRDPRTEPLLLALLSRGELVVKILAAEALGAIGSARAVEPLLQYTRGVLQDGYLKGVARAAIGEIQGRLAGAESGRLSLVEDPAERRGALSMSGDQGALSLPKR